MIPFDAHFAEPKVAFFFLPFLLLIPLVFYRYPQQKKLLALFFKDPSFFLAKKQLKQNLAFLAGGLFLVCACMQPQGYGTIQLQRESQKSLFVPKQILLLVDTSLSMDVQDDQEKATRLQETKQLLQTLLPYLTGVPVGLYTFNHTLTTKAPATYDPFFLDYLVESLHTTPEEGGTNFYNVFSSLQDTLDTPTQVVLFTDGEALGEKEEALFSLLTALQSKDMTLYTVGMGQEAGGVVPNLTYQGKAIHSQVNDSLLEAMAKLGHGAYFPSRLFSQTDLALQLKDKLLAYQRQMTLDTKSNLVVYQPLDTPFLLLALCCFLFSFFAPSKESS